MVSMVSREALAEATERLAADTAQASAGQLSTIADEILSVVVLLRGQPRLRRALTDPARAGAERAELIGGILRDKVSATTTGAVAALVNGRWSRPSELLSAAEQLGVETLLRAADKDGKLTDVEDELFRFAQIVSGDSELAVTLSDPGAPASRRVKLVEDLLKDKVHPVTQRLAEVAVSGFGGRSFEFSLTRLVELTAAKRDREVAYVTVAKPLAEAEEQRLADKLSDMYGRQVSLKVDVDPTVIGGVSVRVGSDLYDGTILRRLNAAKQAFAK